MTKQEKTRVGIGLDVGTSRIVLAEPGEPDYSYRSQLNAFVRIPYSRMTEIALEKESVPFTSDGGELIVHGNESEKLADLLGQETRRPMRCGVLNPGEPESEAQLRGILQSLLGKPAEPGVKICFSVPAPPLNSSDAHTYHEVTVKQMLTAMGYEVISIAEGLAVVYAELEDTNYTGIGISCGGGLCNVCLAYLSVPVASFSIAKAGDYVDAGAAQATGELATRIRISKESGFYFNGHFADRTQQVLHVYYEDMIQSLVDGLRQALTSAKAVPRLGRSVPIVLSGGSVLPKGFRDRFESALKAADLPLPVSEVRQAAQPLFATAKGALRTALSE
jgi:hypothetical protein